MLDEKVLWFAKVCHVVHTVIADQPNSGRVYNYSWEGLEPLAQQRYMRLASDYLSHKPQLRQGVAHRVLEQLVTLVEEI